MDINSTPDPERRPLRLLSLDGGGVKGLTTLLILRRIMHRIQRFQNLPTLPRPCDYFDLIGGTSTGGLIAIMLGRLGMDIESCISAYRKLSKEVFGKARSGGGVFGKVWNTARGKSWFKAERLERALKEVIKEACGSENEPLLGFGASGCKIFLCAIRTANVEYELLRSYPSHEEDHGCSLWEAGRATSAAPMFFDPIPFSKGGAVFADGAMLLNNPTRQLLHESDALWPNVPIGCIISIGTGMHRVKKLQKSVKSILEVCVKISTNAQEEHDRFMKDQRGTELWESEKYLRFNVDHGMSDISLYAWNEMEHMDAVTKAYLSRKEVVGKLEISVERLI